MESTISDTWAGIDLAINSDFEFSQAKGMAGVTTHKSIVKKILQHGDATLIQSIKRIELERKTIELTQKTIQENKKYWLKNFFKKIGIEKSTWHNPLKAYFLSKGLLWEINNDLEIDFLNDRDRAIFHVKLLLKMVMENEDVNDVCNFHFGKSYHNDNINEWHFSFDPHFSGCNGCKNHKELIEKIWGERNFDRFNFVTWKDNRIRYSLEDLIKHFDISNAINLPIIPPAEKLPKITVGNYPTIKDWPVRFRFALDLKKPEKKELSYSACVKLYKQEPVWLIRRIYKKWVEYKIKQFSDEDIRQILKREKDTDIKFFVLSHFFLDHINVTEIKGLYLFENTWPLRLRYLKGIHHCKCSKKEQIEIYQELISIEQSSVLRDNIDYLLRRLL